MKWKKEIENSSDISGFEGKNETRLAAVGFGGSRGALSSTPPRRAELINAQELVITFTRDILAVFFHHMRHFKDGNIVSIDVVVIQCSSKAGQVALDGALRDRNQMRGGWSWALGHTPAARPRSSLARPPTDIMKRSQRFLCGS